MEWWEELYIKMLWLDYLEEVGYLDLDERYRQRHAIDSAYQPLEE